HAAPRPPLLLSLSFFHPPPPPSTHPLSLHDALPISRATRTASSCPGSPCTCSFSAATGSSRKRRCSFPASRCCSSPRGCGSSARSEEHTSELQSLTNLVCRLLLGKKKQATQAALQQS